MKVRPIESADELHAVYDFIAAAAAPDWGSRNGRGRDYFDRRIAGNTAVCVAAEDSSGVVAASLASLDGSSLVHADEYISSGIDSAWYRRQVVDHISTLGEKLGATRLACPSRTLRAEQFESMGFSPTLFIQMYGENRDDWRRKFLEEIRDDYRVLGLRTYRGEVAQANIAIPEVNDFLLNYVEDNIPACEGGSLFMMYRWIGEACGVSRTGVLTYRRPRYVVTCHPRFRKSANAEVRIVDPLAKVYRTDDDSREIVSIETPGHDLDAAFSAEKPVFVRHLAPVQERVELCGDHTDVERITAAVLELGSLDPDKSFAVECRKANRTVSGMRGPAMYGSRDVEVYTGSTLEALGYRVELEHPEQQVSVYLSRLFAFIGVSKSKDNLSPRGDEYRYKSRFSDVISRAQHKLEEAIEEFGIDLSKYHTAIDLGAAPGGWSKVLADSGISVLAVDPGELAPAMSRYPNVTHHKCRFEELELQSGSVDFLVNDMALDPPESAALMCRAADVLAPEALAVMTIKFPTLNVARHIEDATGVLAHAYHVRSMRHLFHNRQEVTALLQRREEIADGWESSVVPRGAARR